MRPLNETRTLLARQQIFSGTLPGMGRRSIEFKSNDPMRCAVTNLWRFFTTFDATLCKKNKQQEDEKKPFNLGNHSSVLSYHRIQKKDPDLGQKNYGSEILKIILTKEFIKKKKFQVFG